jgi:hypothetical protein
MNPNSKKGPSISRRKIFPILGGSLLLPLFGFGNKKIDTLKASNEEEYQTVLKPDGTSVKIKVSTLNNAKIIKKNISNKSFLNWLGRKL